VAQLGEAAGFTVVVYDRLFAHKDRAAYFAGVAQELMRIDGSKAVLLDPDTGLEPATASAEHVTVDDVRATWNALAEGDWLLLYQHRWRDTGWKQSAESRFAAACGGAHVELYQASAKPSDVILLAARKERAVA
jgi:hypothetical protein